MKPEKRHVSLSVKSLEKVWSWCEANPNHPFSDFYMSLCESVGVIRDHKPDFYPELKKVAIQEWLFFARVDYKSNAMKSRDHFGRIILDGLKSGKLK